MKRYPTKPFFAMLLSALAITLTACSEDEPLVRVAAPQSHQDYLFGLSSHGLSETSAGQRWIDASVRVFSESTRVLAPFFESTYLEPLEIGALGYEFPATLGQRIDMVIDTALTGFFVDIFLLEGDHSGRLVSTNPRYPEPLHSWVADPGELSFEPRETGRYLLRIQPPLFHGGEVAVSLLADAALQWPIPGTDRGRIWSFFGDSRAGGARVHHGLDIFAPRGTPLIAVSQSRVMRVGQRDLGGNIVTLDDAERGLRIYYAHLDAQLATQGALVEPGDVIGTVGNSGNAITTPPHLHIGIYQTNWRRPVDPWYFFVAPDRTLPLTPQSPYEFGSWLRTTAEVTPIRYPAARSGVLQSPARANALGSPIDVEQIAPSSQNSGAPVSAPLAVGTPLRLKGVRRSVYRVALPTGEVGYVSRNLLLPAIETLETIVASEPVAARIRPDSTSDVVAQFEVGEEISVLARFASRYGMVLRENGHVAWIDLAAAGGQARSFS